MWGDFDEAPSSKKARKAASAAEGWEALLQQRQAVAQATDFTFEASKPRSVAFLVAGQPSRLQVASGQQLLKQWPALLPFTVQEKEKRLVDLRELGVHYEALVAAVSFATQPGAGAGGDFWSPKGLRPMSRASEDAKEVEKALHCLEVLRLAQLLELKVLRDEAEKRLQEGLLSEANALPLLASSFAREKLISQRCVRLLSMAGKDFLRGKERQLGVIYATAPVVGSLIAGLFKAVGPSEGQGAALSSELRDLLHGPREKS